MTKIYTKTGDKGETSLVGGIRVAKDSARLEAYGTVDELSSHIGLLVAMLREKSGEAAEDIKLLERVQNELFNVSTLLATDEEALAEKADGTEWIKGYLEKMEAMRDRLPEETKMLEARIDVLTEELPQLNNFILPGGSKSASQCHVCRTVCRRAERRIIASPQSSVFRSTPSNLQQYMNRLSDYLYVLARKINIIYGVEEKTWQNTCRK